MGDLRAAGVDAAPAPAPAPGAAADARAWRSSWPQRLGAGDRRCGLPPRPHPPPPPPRRGEGGSGVGAGKAEDDAGGATGSSRGGGAGAVPRAGPGADADAKGGDAGAEDVPGGGCDGGAAWVLVAAREEGAKGGEAAGSKKRSFATSSAAVPRAYPPPKRRSVYAVRRFPPGCGRGGDGADDGSRLVTAAPASLTKPAAARRPPLSVGEAGCVGVPEKAPAAVDVPRLVVGPARQGGGGCAASPTKPVAAPSRSVGEAASVGALKKASATVVHHPIADTGRHGPHAAALKPLEPSYRSSVAAAEGLLDTDSQGCSGSSGFGSGKEVVRLLPKPRAISAIRRFPPGCGRVSASQPLSQGTK
ncbi:unnamed protein product [Urochloa humidicola]